MSAGGGGHAEPFHAAPLSIATVNDASSTTRIKVRSGPSDSSRYSLVALLDTGPLQTFISNEAAWARMKYNNAGSDACERHAPTNWPPSSPQPPSGSASTFCMAKPLPLSSLFGRALFQREPCNILFFWDATAGCCMHSAHAPSCPLSPPNRSSANFPSRFLAPKAFLPSSVITDRRNITFVYAVSRPGQLGSLLGCPCPHRPLHTRHAPQRRRFILNRSLRRQWVPNNPTLRIH